MRSFIGASFRRESDESARHVDRICLCGNRRCAPPGCPRRRL